MLEAIRLYVEGTVAAIIMVMLGVFAGLATLVLSGDLRAALFVAATTFTLAGIVLTIRLWRMTRAPAPPTEPRA